jgi:3-methyladenine DNA glycosylase AlkD
MSPTAKKLLAEITAYENPESGLFLQRFFKTGPGEYGEGDLFLGLKVPQTRAIVQKYYKDITISDLRLLLGSKWHEVRLAAVIIMCKQYPKSEYKLQKQIYNLYIAQTGKGINNWDIVDISCPYIIGAHLFNRNREPLYELAKGGLWQKRVSIISTFYFLRHGEPVETYNLAEILVYEKHDLLQKAVGWSIREMGKRDGQLLRQFLDTYAATMPRTALRYSLEKLTDSEKRSYMNAHLGTTKV